MTVPPHFSLKAQKVWLCEFSPDQSRGADEATHFSGPVNLHFLPLPGRRQIGLLRGRRSCVSGSEGKPLEEASHLDREGGSLRAHGKV